MYNVVELMENGDLIPLMQAAQNNDTAYREKLPPDQQECFDYYVEYFNKIREQNGGTLKGIDFDLPYSY